MAISRSAVALLGAGILGIAGIGLGAGATFTDAVNTTQTVTAGTISVSVTSPTGVLSPDGKTVTLPAFGPVGSTFQTSNSIITVHNTGNIAVTSAAFQLSQTTDGSAASAALRDQTNVCIKSTDLSGTWVEGNGKLMTGVNLVPSVGQNPITLLPGESMTFSVNFYAGQNSTGCGTTTSDGPTTAARWGAYSMPAALTGAAMGGVLSPTLTFAFTG